MDACGILKGEIDIHGLDGLKFKVEGLRVYSLWFTVYGGEGGG